MERFIENAESLRVHRKKLKLNQQQMASFLGLSKSAYVAIETETAVFRKIHGLAAERVFAMQETST